MDTEDEWDQGESNGGSELQYFKLIKKPDRSIRLLITFEKSFKKRLYKS